MTDQTPRTCPHCGSNHLVTHRKSRRIFFNHAGERIPLLTVNFALDHPVVEERSTTYTCTCSWAGSAAECTQTT